MRINVQRVPGDAQSGEQSGKAGERKGAKEGEQEGEQEDAQEDAQEGEKVTEADLSSLSPCNYRLAKWHIGLQIRTTLWFALFATIV